MKRYIRNADIVTDNGILENHDIEITENKITDIFPHRSFEKDGICLDRMYISAGFIDLHCHGGGGAEFIDGTKEAVKTALDVHKKGGTAIIYPTLSATDTNTVCKALDIFEKYRSDGIKIGGIHLEGPYFNAEMCGAQDTSFIRLPDKKEYTFLLERYGGLIKRWSYAPEKDTGCDFVKYITSNNVRASAGHSAATYTDMISAVQNGLNCVTHLYSCTSTVTRESGFRKLGIIETVFLLDDLYAEAIGDGAHLPPELLKMIVKIKGKDRVALVTDAIRFAGLTDTENLKSVGNVDYIVEDGVAKLADRSAFAGSIATLQDVLKRTVAGGIPLCDTVTMMTKTPANVMELKTAGQIEIGFDAVFTVFDKELNIKMLD